MLVWDGYGQVTIVAMLLWTRSRVILCRYIHRCRCIRRGALYFDVGSHTFRHNR
uniref:Uncharacterized protein n=1 Tax=Arundo donax TaxID=35708 RepID=A0A0A9FMJ2_ARUDO